MSDTTTLLLSDEDIFGTGDGLSEEMPRQNIRDIYERSRANLIAEGVRLEAENAALRERLAVLDGTAHPVAKNVEQFMQLLGSVDSVPSQSSSDASLRAAAQVAADAGERMKHFMVRCGMYGSDGEPTGVDEAIEEWNTALTALAEHGVTPTLKP